MSSVKAGNGLPDPRSRIQDLYNFTDSTRRFVGSYNGEHLSRTILSSCIAYVSNFPYEISHISGCFARSGIFFDQADVAGLIGLLFGVFVNISCYDVEH